MVWGCFVGDTVCDLFRIQGTLNQHGYHSILQQYSWFVLVCTWWDYHLFSNTPPGCVRAILPIMRVMESCIR